jgi:hypothetical protein
MKVFLCSHLSSIFGPTIICDFTTQFYSLPVYLEEADLPCVYLHAASVCCTTAWFATHIQSIWKNPISFSTCAADQNID